MAIAIYEDVQTGRQHWADSTSPTTADHLADGGWVLVDDTPATPPPPGDPLDLLMAAIAADADSDFSAAQRAAFGAVVPVTRFGVSTAKTAAENDAAFAAALASGEPLYLPPGVYNINTTIDLYQAASTTLIGAGPGLTTLRMNSAVPIVRMGLDSKMLAGIDLEYATVQPSTATTAVGIEIRALRRSVIDRVTVSFAAFGMDVPAIVSDGLSSNYLFSNTITNMRFSRCSNMSMRLESWNAGSTGNVFSNIYTEGWVDFAAGTKQTVSTVISLGTHDATVLQNINIEHVVVSGGFGFKANGCRNLVVNALHFEGVDLTGWGSCLVSIFGTDTIASITGMDVADVEFIDGQLGVFQIGVNTDLAVRGLHMRLLTKTTTDPTSLCYGDNDSRVEITGYDNATPAAITSAAGLMTGASQFPGLKRLNDDRFHYTENGKHVTFGTAAPTAGTWAVGDKRWNTAPAAGGAPGWVCTTAGTPGTWKAMANLAA